MDWEEIRRNWDSYREDAKHTWGKLSVADLDAAAGNRDKLITSVKEGLGISLEEAETEVDAWAKRMTEIQAT